MARELVSSAPLPSHIGMVIGRCAEKQMVGIDTRRVITMVTDLHAIGNRSIYRFPHDPVGKTAFPTHHEVAVSFWHAGAGPQPAGLCPKNSRFEAIQQGAIPSRVSAAKSITVLGPAAIHLAGFSKERGSAVCADARDGKTTRHRWTSSIGVTPPAVHAARGYRVPQFYHEGNDP